MKTKRIFIRLRSIWRRLTRGLEGPKYEMTNQDRIIVRLVKSMLAKDDLKIFYAPISHSIYMETDDHEYTVIYDNNEIRVANHKIFLSTKMSMKVGDELMRIGRRKIERSINSLDVNIRKNEIRFIEDIAKILERDEENGKQL